MRFLWIDNTLMRREKKQTGTPTQRSWFREFIQLNDVFGYYFRGKDPSRPINFNIRMMHGINKISMLVFLLGVLYLVFKLVIKPAL